MNTIGYFKVGDRVQATTKEDGTQYGTVIYSHRPLINWVDVKWDNKFTNAKTSISLDGRIIQGMNGNYTITHIQ